MIYIPQVNFHNQIAPIVVISCICMEVAQSRQRSTWMWEVSHSVPTKVCVFKLLAWNTRTLNIIFSYISPHAYPPTKQPLNQPSDVYNFCSIQGIAGNDRISICKCPDNDLILVIRVIQNRVLNTVDNDIHHIYCIRFWDSGIPGSKTYMLLRAFPSTHKIITISYQSDTANIAIQFV